MTRWRQLLTGLLLGLAGAAFMWFRWEIGLSFSFDFMFGSAFVMLAILVGGPWAGTAAAAIAFSPMLVNYGSPLWFLVFVAEAAVVGVMARTSRHRVILYDVIFWVASTPLLWLLCTRLIGLQPETTQLFLAKQLINSTLNAVLATVAYLAFRSIGAPSTSRPPFGALVFTTLLSVVLIPSTVFLVLTVRDNANHHRTQLVERTMYATRRAEEMLTPLLAAHLGGGVSEPEPLQAAVASVAGRLSIGITVLDRANRVLASSVGVAPGDRFTRFDAGDRVDVDGGVFQWLPPLDSSGDRLQRWWQSIFVARPAPAPGLPWALVVEVAGGPSVREVTRTAVIHSTVLAFFVIVVVGAAEWLSRRLTGPVVQLQALTRRLQQNLKTSAAGAAWPSSRIQEVQDLIDDVRDLNLTLEHRVVERTRELRASEARYREVLEGVQLIALQLDAMGAVTFCNDYTTRLLGWPREELLGRNWFEVCLPPDEASAIVEVFRSAVARNESFPSQYENRVVTRTGERRMVAWNNVTLRGPDGRISGTTSIGADITDALSAQEALRASEERFSRAFSHAPLLLSLSDLATGRFIDVNDTFLQVSGYTREAVIGRTPVEVGITVDEERNRMLDAVRQHGQVSRFERRLRTSTGQERVVRFWAETLEIGGRPTLLSMAEDITDQKAAEVERERLEDQLNEARKMEAVGRLAGGVAHDFNNNLTTMMMQIGMLQADSRITADVRAALDDVMAAAKRSADLTQQLLMFGRRSILQVAPLDLSEVVEKLLAMLRRLLGETIEVSFESSGHLPRVVADRARVEQAILNLAINARDAMPKGGRLTIALSATTVPAAAIPPTASATPGRYVRILVSDTGAGMDDAVRARLFEPFFTTKAPGTGTGLGLASVHGLVAQHQGWIEVDSTPGAGTTFRLFLPAAS